MAACPHLAFANARGPGAKSGRRRQIRSDAWNYRDSWAGTTLKSDGTEFGERLPDADRLKIDVHVGKVGHQMAAVLCSAVYSAARLNSGRRRTGGKRAVWVWGRWGKRCWRTNRPWPKFYMYRLQCTVFKAGLFNSIFHQTRLSLEFFLFLQNRLPKFLRSLIISKTRYNICALLKISSNDCFAGAVPMVFGTVDLSLRPLLWLDVSQAHACAGPKLSFGGSFLLTLGT